MVLVDKILLILFTVALGWKLAQGETVKRDLSERQQNLEFIHLGNLGPISRLTSHPSLAHLGLTPQQTTGLMNVLLQNGFLNPRALKLANGQPFLPGIYSPPVAFPGTFFGIPGPVLDPYIFFLYSNHARYLPFGLGPQGIFGSTGLPKPQALAIFKHDKN